MKKMNLFKMSLVVMVMMFALAAVAPADDVEDYIKEALKYYQDGKYTDAISSLNFAEQVIQQKKSSGLEAFLPAPLSGWEAEAATSQAVAAAMMGGGISAEREYNKGDSFVHIQIMADSPMLQAAMMMISNPMYASADGGKLERVGNQKAILKYDPAEKSGDMQLVVANRFMVSIEGENITAQDLKDYAGAINYDKMASLP